MAQPILLKDIAEHINAELVGQPELLIDSIQSIENAKSTDLAFLSNPRFKSQLHTTQAGAVILRTQDAQEFSGNKLIVDNPYLAYAQASSLFKSIIEPSLTLVDESVKIHDSAVIGANVSIGKNVHVGAGCFIGAGVSIADDCVIGSGSVIYSNVSIYSDVRIGENCTIHSGAVLGADGFGFAHNGSGWVKIYQLGGVSIGNNVEIGACSTVDRGAIDDTELADGVIIDNHVQIAHNVKVGKNTAMAAFTGISGSTIIGENCTFAGRSGTVGHIEICAGVHVSAGTIITKSITQPGAYSSGTGMSTTKQWRKNAARFNQLDEMAKRLAVLEQKLDKN